MSALATSIAHPLEVEFQQSPRRGGLRVVDTPVARRRPRLMYGVVALGGAIAIAACQMTLSIMTTQTSYEIAALNQEQRELSWQSQILYDEVAGLSSPQYLAANAAALGMVINESPSYLRLSDGAILGTSAYAEDSSAVDAIGRAAVSNKLIADTPLITVPAATLDGLPLPALDPTIVEGDSQTPPMIADGLPTPTTH